MTGPVRAVLAHEPFAGGVPRAWCPSLWVTLDDDWSGAIRVVASRAPGPVHLWRAQQVLEASAVSTRRRAHGERPSQMSVVLQTTVAEHGGPTLFGDLAMLHGESIDAAGEFLRDDQAAGSSALLCSTGAGADLGSFVSLLDAAWLGRRRATSSSFVKIMDVLIQQVREAGMLLVLPFAVVETGEGGIVAFGQLRALEAIVEASVWESGSPDSLGQAWLRGLSVSMT